MHVDTLPSLAGEYWRAFAHSKPGLAHGQEIPRHTLEVAATRIDVQALARYRAFVGSVEEFPLAYAYVLAQPAQFHLINQPDFPVRCVGLVHADNRIVRHAAIDLAQPLSLSVASASDRVRRRGREFTLHTRIVQGGQTVIEMDSGTFTRVRGAPRDAGCGSRSPGSGGDRRASTSPICALPPTSADAMRASPAITTRSIWPAGWRVPSAFAAPSLTVSAAWPGSMPNSGACSGMPTRELSIRFRRPVELPCATRLHRSAGTADGYVLVDATGT